jgi:arsenate reductase-like glutaredoxin family protein
MSAGPDIIIYHNPDCGTSRNTLAMIRNAGIEPHVIEYLKTPPARALLASLLSAWVYRCGRFCARKARRFTSWALMTRA